MTPMTTWVLGGPERFLAAANLTVVRFHLSIEAINSDRHPCRLVAYCHNIVSLLIDDRIVWPLLDSWTGLAPPCRFNLVAFCWA